MRYCLAYMLCFFIPAQASAQRILNHQLGIAGEYRYQFKQAFEFSESNSIFTSWRASQFGVQLFYNRDISKADRGTLSVSSYLTTHHLRVNGGEILSARTWADTSTTSLRSMLFQLSIGWDRLLIAKRRSNTWVGVQAGVMFKSRDPLISTFVFPQGGNVTYIASSSLGPKTLPMIGPRVGYERIIDRSLRIHFGLVSQVSVIRYHEHRLTRLENGTVFSATSNRVLATLGGYVGCSVLLGEL